MLKVEKKDTRSRHPKDEKLEKTQSETNQEQRQEEVRIRQTQSKGHVQEFDTYEIDHQTLPYIFRFNYAALQRLKMKKSNNIPKIAIDIFQYLKDKLIVRRYSEGGKYPNRMKYQEKVKFLIRAFDHRRGSVPSDCPKRKEKFNRQKQLEFFTRPEVKEHFMEEINDALIRKRAQNQRRIRQIEDCIQMAMQFSKKQPAKAEKVFEQRIKRKQLPWTDNMFEDMQDFSKQLFYRFTMEPVNLDRSKQESKKDPLNKNEQQSGQGIQGLQDDQQQYDEESEEILKQESPTPIKEAKMVKFESKIQA